MVATDVHEPGLRRGAIGLGDALAGTLANMAPVEGIFIVLVIVAAAMGTLTPWAFVLGAVGILLTGWNFSQLARRVPARVLTSGSPTTARVPSSGAGPLPPGRSRST